MAASRPLPVRQSRGLGRARARRRRGRAEGGVFGLAGLDEGEADLLGDVGVLGDVGAGLLAPLRERWAR